MSNTNTWNIYPESLIHYEGKFWIYWKDRNSKFLGCNIHMANAIGLSDPKEIIGLSDYDLDVLQKERDHFIAADRTVMKSKITKQFWDTFTTEGQRFNLIAIKSPLIVNDEIIGIYGMSYINDMKLKSLNENISTGKNIFNLTNRELEVTKFIVKAKTAKEIAKILFLSNRTVEHHIANIRIKTNCVTRSQIVSLMSPYFEYN